MESKELPNALWSTEPLKDDFYDDGSHDVVAGLITFDAEHGIEVTIPHGALLDYPVSPEGVCLHTVEVLSADAVYGYAQNNRYYLLEDVVVRSTRSSHPGFKAQTLQGVALFISSRPIRPNPMVRHISVCFPGLREWAGRPSFDVTEIIDEQKRRLKELSMSYRPDPVDDLPLYCEDGVDVVVCDIATLAGGPVPNYEFGFEADRTLEFSFAEPVEFDLAMEQWVRPTINFLAYCMGFRQPVSSIKLTTADGVDADYLIATGMSGDPLSADQVRSMPFPYGVMGGRTSGMLAEWFKLDEYGRNASTMLVSLVSERWAGPYDMFFLAAAQILEALSRSGADEHEMIEEEFQERLDAVEGAIKRADPEGHPVLSSKKRKWLMHKLQNSNWKPAAQLLKELLEKLGSYPSFVVPDVKTFLDDHRSYRNAYTHRTDVKNARRLSPEQIMIHAGAVQLLAYGALAVMLGFSPDEAIERMETSNFKWYARYRANKLYALGGGGSDEA